MRFSHARLFAFTIVAGLACAALDGKPVSASSTEFPDEHTQRNGMHACPAHTAMLGLDVRRNELTCSSEFAIAGTNQEIVDHGTQRRGMHACPEGMAMTGVHVDANLLSCTPLEPVQGSAQWAEYVDTWSAHFGDRGCAPGYVMTGVHVDKHERLCAAWSSTRICDQRVHCQTEESGDCVSFQYQCLYCSVACAAPGQPLPVGCEWDYCPNAGPHPL